MTGRGEAQNVYPHQANTYQLKIDLVIRRRDQSKCRTGPRNWPSASGQKLSFASFTINPSKLRKLTFESVVSYRSLRTPKFRTRSFSGDFAQMPYGMLLAGLNLFVIHKSTSAGGVINERSQVIDLYRSRLNDSISKRLGSYRSI